MRKQTAGLREPVLERFVSRVKRAAGLRGTVNVLVTTSRELRVMNRRFRGLDKATDVLSFPPIVGLVADFAGDVAISADIAAQNARRFGHSPATEIKILALHGILHLAGYDHERDRGQMARREARLRRQFNLPLGLIRRNSERSTFSLANTLKVARRAQRPYKLNSKAADRNVRATFQSRGTR